MPLSSESSLPRHAYHECRWLPEIGTQVVYANLAGSGSEKSWWLYAFKEATEIDLEIGKADYVGELLESRQHLIRHCPFCGIELSKELPLEYQP